MQRIIIPLLFILFAGISLSAQDNAKYIGVWRTGKSFSQDLNRGVFANGIPHIQKFTDIQQYASRPSGQQVAHYGVFGNEGTKNKIVVGTWPEIGPIPVKNLNHPGGQHIHSIESTSRSNEYRTRFHVILKPGKRSQRINMVTGWNGFVADWKEMTKSGMRLREVVATRDLGKQRFVGLYEKGSGGHYLYSLTGWKAFTDKWAELAKKNYRLVDVETFRVGSNIQYIGVWAPGKDGYALIQVTGYDNFKQKFYEMKGKGLFLVDLDVLN